MRSIVATSVLLVSFLLAPEDAGAKKTRKPKTGPAAEQLLKQGDALAMVGSFDEAAKAYRKALDADANLSLAKVRLAHCLWKAGQVAEALKLLEPMAAEANPNVDGLSLLADIYLDAKEHQKAAGVLEKLVARRSSDLSLKLQLAQCYRQMAEGGNAEAKTKAIELFAEIEKSASDPHLRRTAMEAGLTMRFGELGKRILVAKEQLADGKAVEALRALNTIAAQNSQVGYVHYLRGLACLNPSVDDRKQAMTAFGKAKGVADADFQLGVLHYEEGDLKKSAERLKAAIKADATHQQAHYQLGLLYREEGHDKKAIDAWQKAVSLGPGTPIAQWAHTKMQVLTGRIQALAAGQVIDPASEILIGKRTCELIEKRWPVIKDPRLEQRLTRIMDRLLVHSDRPKRDLRYQIAVINVPVVNALTVPNGKIYFFTGLVDLIRTRMGDKDDAYAAVLAHEISHNTLRHGSGMIKMASTQKDYQSFWQLMMLMNALSRTHEFEADQYGVLYAYRAGYDPSYSVLLHQKMLQNKGEIPKGMTHPQHAERIERLRDYMLELRAKVRNFNKGVEALKTKKYDVAVDHFEIFLGVFPDSAAARNNLAVALHEKALMATEAAPVYRRSTDIDPEARIKTIKLRSTADEERRSRKLNKRLLWEAAGEYAMVLKKDPGYAQAHSNLGTALSDLGDLKRAKQHLQNALKVNPRYKEAMNNLAIVLAQQNDLKGAAAQLQHAVKLDGKYACAFFNLGLVLEKLGNKVEAAKAWEKYVALDSTSGWATVARARRAALKI
ncbi:MAG: tetratricopeptide repeat protein [Deltaproteobacteria bacterium]|nr:tetratricopeptide repeat protein [Deltaproteobacteria bacterium]